MPTLTPELQQAIREAGDEPVRLEDPETNRAYVLIAEEAYHQMREHLEYDGGPWTPEERDIMLQDFGERAGWNDPAMDVYDDLDPPPET